MSEDVTSIDKNLFLRLIRAYIDFKFSFLSRCRPSVFYDVPIEVRVGYLLRRLISPAHSKLSQTPNIEVESQAEMACDGFATPPCRSVRRPPTNQS